jgi:valyl-tRNA synthetase
VNPDDKRYAHLVGRHVKTPLFDVTVPVFAHNAAEIDKGTGVVMCCTFGDITDVQWCRDLDLPIRSVLQKNGRIINELPSWIESETGKEVFENMQGKTLFSARNAIIESLKQHNMTVGEPTPTTRMVQFYEKGERPLEIIPSRQWYVKNGGTDTELKNALLDAGNTLNFYPKFMHVRFENWVKGLTNDWLISRQRFFGVPFPLWYPMLASGKVDREHPILPSHSALPIDPTIDVPQGFTEAQRGKAGGFVAEQDIMDTWAISSLTPQIAGKEGIKDGTEESTGDSLFSRVFPYSVRPQGQDIIRTWLFSTVVRSLLAHGTLPFHNALISGWILDPDRKKMSKSKGNVVTPLGLLQQYSPDGARYWAANARLGVDTMFDEQQMKVGRRLAIKILNVSKFVFGILERDAGDAVSHNISLANVTHELDKSMLLELRNAITLANESLEKFEHTKALEVIEAFFWDFCDNYVELVKERAYSTTQNSESAQNATSAQNSVTARNETSEQNSESAKNALFIALDVLLRAFAPYLPYATDEVWSWFKYDAKPISIHNAQFPTENELLDISSKTDYEQSPFALASSLLSQLRGIKTKEKVSMRAPMSVELSVNTNAKRVLESVIEDVKNASNIQSLSIDYAPLENCEVKYRIKAFSFNYNV